MRAVRLLLVAFASGALLVACNGDDDPGPVTTTSAAPSSTAASTTSTSSQPCTVPGAATTFRAKPGDGPTALLTAVRAGRQGCADRVVLDFRGGPPPGYTAGYEPGPFTLGQSDMPVAVDGSAFLVVRMTPASGVDLSTPNAEPTYTGPESVRPSGLSHVREIRRLEDFEGTLVWVIGLDAQRPFTVGTLTGPSRLYVDLADA